VTSNIEVRIRRLGVLAGKVTILSLDSRGTTITDRPAGGQKQSPASGFGDQAWDLSFGVAVTYELAQSGRYLVMHFAEVGRPLVSGAPLLDLRKGSECLTPTRQRSGTTLGHCRTHEHVIELLTSKLLYRFQSLFHVAQRFNCVWV
jgi:hypothetical protein